MTLADILGQELDSRGLLWFFGSESVIQPAPGAHAWFPDSNTGYQEPGQGQKPCQSAGPARSRGPWGN